MKTKQRLLMGFCVLILLLSAATVTIQAFADPMGDIIDLAAEACQKYCDDQFDPKLEDPIINAANEGCVRGCLWGWGNGSIPNN